MAVKKKRWDTFISAGGIRGLGEAPPPLHYREGMLAARRLGLEPRAGRLLPRSLSALAMSRIFTAR
jgi:hypothetical protein